MSLLFKGAALLTLYEGALSVSRFNERRQTFAIAKARAATLNRPLVVVGDPDSGLHTRFARAYDCGHLCVDLHGCSKCTCSLPADISRPLPIESDSAVVFVSCTLEYVPDAPGAVRELLRVAGDPKNLFVVTVSPFSLSFWLLGGKWAVRAPPGVAPTLAPLRSPVPGDGSLKQALGGAP